MDQSWEVRYSNSRSRPYFYSHATAASVWDTPAGLTEEQVRALPGADEYLNTTAPPKKASGSNKVKASHLLIKHSGSRRPSSWKDAVITRSQADAVAILEAHQKALRQAPDLALAFAALARTESDCSSAREGGDLGWFGPKQMQKPFEDASFATPVGKMSDIVSTESGVHLILRTA